MSSEASVFENQLHPFIWLGHLIMMFLTKRFVTMSAFIRLTKTPSALHKHLTPVCTSGILKFRELNSSAVILKKLSMHCLHAIQFEGQLIKWGSSRMFKHTIYVKLF